MKTLRTVVTAAALIMCVAVAHAEDRKSTLSARQCEIWATDILQLIDRDMPKLEATTPVTLEEAHELFKELTYIPDDPNTWECPGPANTLRRKGGDCEDMTMYVIARIAQLDSYAADQVGFVMMIDEDKAGKVYAHIAVVLFNPDDLFDPHIIDVAERGYKYRTKMMHRFSDFKEGYKRAGFDFYRIWWFDTETEDQHDIYPF